MNILVNGKTKEVHQGLSLVELMVQLKLGQGRIAIEVNGEIVPRSLFDQHILKDGDALEIVQAIGGG